MTRTEIRKYHDDIWKLYFYQGHWGENNAIFYIKRKNKKWWQRMWVKAGKIWLGLDPFDSWEWVIDDFVDRYYKQLIEDKKIEEFYNGR